MLPLIAASVGLGAVRAGLGVLSARKTAKRNRGLISQAYARGHERLDTSQGDQRQLLGEGLIARGLGGAGGDMGRVAPGAPVDRTHAHDLGSQSMVDQRYEQGLAQTELLRQRDNALTENKAAATQGIIGSLLGGVQTGMDVYSAGSSLGAMRGATAAAGHAPALSSGIGGGFVDHPFTDAWGGIDPIDPLGTVGGFNVFSGGR